MSAESTEAFINDVQGRIDYFRREYEISYVEVVGALDILKHGMIIEIKENNEGDE